MGLLAIIFGVWGIGDILRTTSRISVAKIGDREISVEEFRQQFNDRVQQLGRQVGRAITAEQARAVGLDRQVLGQMLAEAALDQRATQLRLAMSDAEVGRRITEDPAFKGPTGQFDRFRFEQIIRQAGYTEPRFVAEQRQVLLRRQIVNSVIGDLKAPKAAVETLYRFQNEERAVDYVVLGRDQAGTVPSPTPEELSKYFEDHKVLFRAPEYRKVVLLSLTPEDLSRTIEVSEDVLNRTYEAQKARYSTPEKRQVEQIVFLNAEEAAKAAERLAGGLAFSALATERGLSAKDIDLGLLTKADFVDPAVAEAAFSLKQGATSGPVKGRFGTVILHVTKIEPGVTRSFSEVRDQIRNDLTADQAKEQLSKLRDKVEDELASGLRVEEVAKKLNLKARVIDAIDRSGRDADGNVVGNLPQGVDVVASAFSSDVGVENDALQLRSGGYVWYDVAGITPARDRTLDEVKSRVEARWRDDQVVSRLKSKTTAMLEKLKAGSSLSDVAAAEHLPIKQVAGLKRQGSAEGMAPGTIAEVFRTAKGEAASADGKDPTERVVFRVTNIGVPPFDPASNQAKQMSENIRGALGDNILGEYISRLQNDLGVSVHPAGLSQAIGGSPVN